MIKDLKEKNEQIMHIMQASQNKQILNKIIN